MLNKVGNIAGLIVVALWTWLIVTGPSRDASGWFVLMLSISGLVMSVYLTARPAILDRGPVGLVFAPLFMSIIESYERGLSLTTFGVTLWLATFIGSFLFSWSKRRPLHSGPRTLGN